MKPDDMVATYKMLFAPVRDTVKRVLEIGVYQGGSLALWRDYFPNATIVGADIRRWCRRYESDRVKVRTGSQHDRAFLDSLSVEFGQFDIVIDDGSHHWEDQRATFEYFYDKPWRFYAVEDLHTSYVPHDWAYYDDEPEPQTMVATLSRVLDAMHCSRLQRQWPAAQYADRTIARMTFTPGLCVMEKRP